MKNLENEQIIFIAETANFFDKISFPNGLATTSNNDILLTYRSELAYLSKKLFQFSFNDIKNILVAFNSGTGHSFLGVRIAEILIKLLEDRMEASDFLRLVKDPDLAHLYKYF